MCIFYNPAQSLDQRLANYCPWAKSCLLPVLAIKFLLEHSHTHLFTQCPWLHLRAE